MTELIETMPSAGMKPVDPAHCTELLQLCTVMNWAPKLPLLVMHDEQAGRWFLKGASGAVDYWIRDTDIEALKRTPMWLSVIKAAPYGTTATALYDMIKDLPGPPPLDEVEKERLELSRSRLAAEARIKELDDWE